ncbi:UvrD-helicase domain-containing protein [Enterococcus faecalis]
MINKLLIAAAGAGKTTFFVKEAIECSESVLITTFTEENRDEIRKKFIELNDGAIPSNVTIQTWFSFLIEHGAKPYQGILTEKKINGLELVNQKSGLKFKKDFPVYYPEKEVDKHYFNSEYQIYSDKLSKFVVKCNEGSSGKVIARISDIFKNIFIDEVQDMAGHDLEVIKLLMNTDSVIKMAGDPRQVTYHTHFASKFKKYSNGKIQEFIEKECSRQRCEIDLNTLSGSWRNNQSICNFSNRLFPDKPECISFQSKTTSHDGIFLVREKDVELYLKKYSPLQLRYDRKNKKIFENYEVKNFGESKGTTYDRVIIYPTKAMLNWVLKDTEINKFDVKCKFYVAITRAKYSVGIVCDNNVKSNLLPIFNS